MSCSALNLETTISSHMKDIVITRASCKKYLPPPDFGSGDTNGFLYNIKKTDQVVGYLFGTVHNLPKNDEDLAKVSPQVLKRLYECPILLTECEATPDDLTSVEGNLASFAQKQKIFNYAVDNPSYRLWLSQSPPSKEEEEEEDLSEEWIAWKGAYRTGNESDIMAHPWTSLSDNPKVDQERNNYMAYKIEAFLNTALWYGQKDFVAIGFGHVLNTYPKIRTVTQLLEDKGFAFNRVN